MINFSAFIFGDARLPPTSNSCECELVHARRKTIIFHSNIFSSSMAMFHALSNSTSYRPRHICLCMSFNKGWVLFWQKEECLLVRTDCCHRLGKKGTLFTLYTTSDNGYVGSKNTLHVFQHRYPLISH